MSKMLSHLRCLFGKHAWDGCVCLVCGKERHEWKYIVDPDAITGPVANFMDEMSTYRQRCTRCGVEKTG